jgi:hypothetical protein
LVSQSAAEAVSESAIAGENVSKAIFDLPGVQWPDDPQCGECGALVGDDGV